MPEPLTLPMQVALCLDLDGPQCGATRWRHVWQKGTLSPWPVFAMECQGKNTAAVWVALYDLQHDYAIYQGAVLQGVGAVKVNRTLSPFAHPASPEHYLYKLICDELRASVP